MVDESRPLRSHGLDYWSSRHRPCAMALVRLPESATYSHHRKGLSVRVALYARYSSDQQSAASIEDQLRICREFVGRHGWTVTKECTDAAMSGASLIRPGLQSLLAAALAGELEAVVAESLDRFSRDQEDTAGLFKRLRFAGVKMVTLSEGEIDVMHVGFKGTMNALYLKDLADKTRRGLRGRVEAGKSGGGLCYGYRAAAGAIGDRVIEATEAARVVQIFEWFASGVSPKAIAKRLNAAGIPGPGNRTWGPSTINGHVVRGTGILNNELYVGRMVWNRLRYLKDPDTGRRVSRLNPPSALVTADVPDLRIVPDALWQAVKARQVGVRRDSGPLVGARRPVYLFSGLTKCAVCGRGYTMYSASRLACSGARDRGICTNKITIPRHEVEQRVLAAIQDHFSDPATLERISQKTLVRLNQARMQQRAAAAASERRRGVIDRHLAKLVQALTEGVPASTVRDKMVALEAEKAALAMPTPEAGPLLHPKMARVIAAKVEQLRQGLSVDTMRDKARDGLRGLVDEIVFEPRADGGLTIWVKGNLAALFGEKTGAPRAPRQVKMVAGARNRRDLADGWIEAA